MTRLCTPDAMAEFSESEADIALQNINLMLGLLETTGLERVPIYP